MKLGVRYQIFLLAAIVLGIYYPALSAGVNSVDDSHIIAAYGMGAGKGLVEILRPTENYYYRPLVELSYYLDNLLWGMHSRFMHLENILFHLLNTVLVFLIARQVAEDLGCEVAVVPPGERPALCGSSNQYRIGHLDCRPYRSPCCDIHLYRDLVSAAVSH